MAVVDGSSDFRPMSGGRQASKGRADRKGKGPGTDAPADESTVTIEEPLGEPTPEEIKEWYNAQVPYNNIASNPEVADRALHYVKTVKRNWEDKTIAQRDKWRAIQWMMRGNSLSRTFPNAEVHVPELYKKRETLVPRIEEAVMDYKPWFRVMGRESMDEVQEEKIAAYLDYQLDKCNLAHKHAPTIRTMLDYGFVVLKIWYECKTTSYVKKTTERVEELGESPKYVIKRERTTRADFGPRIKLVDPLDFLIEALATDPQEALYVGDSVDMTFDEIAAMGRQGVYENWEQLRGVRRSMEQYTDYDRLERSLTYSNHGFDNEPEGTAAKIRVTEVWGRFDPYDTGETAEYVITIANDSVVLRVQENPFDSKHRPYAVARVAGDSYEFLGVGPFDHAIRLNIELDEHRNLALQAHRNALCPLTFVSDDTDFPDSIWEVEPGSVFRTPTPPTFMKVPDSWSNMEQSNEMFRRDIDEVTGATTQLMGTGPADSTATADINRTTQGNKRIQGYVRAYTRMLEQLLRQLHMLNRQFVTRGMTFRVLGKAAKGLAEYEEIGPEAFDHEIDFTFMGVSNLATLGQRASNMMSFMNVAAPVMNTQPDRIDGVALLRNTYRYMVGDHMGEEKIFKDISLDDMLPQDAENLMLARGQKVAVHPQDNDEEHMARMAHIMGNPEVFGQFPVKTQKLFIEHYAGHEMGAEQKRLQQQAAQNPAQTMLPAQQQAGRNGTIPGPATATDSVAQTPRGETPGPPDPSKVAAPGRQMSTSQTNNSPVR